MISEEDMELVMRQMGGNSLGAEESRELVRRVMRTAGVAAGSGMSFPQYRTALEGVEIHLGVEVPVDY
jgi:hypothetical protein